MAARAFPLCRRDAPASALPLDIDKAPNNSLASIDSRPDPLHDPLRRR